MGSGLSIGGPPKSDRQGVAHPSPVLRISDIDRRAASPLVGEEGARGSTAAYHPADDADADAEQKIAGEDIDDHHDLAHDMSGLVIHEP
jgi:hypothetical protein